MPDVKVPVVVTYTYTHVVWVEAPELEDGEPLREAMEAAAEWIDDQPYEHTDDKSTLTEAYWDVRVPTADDMRNRVYGSTGFPGGGTKHDAHVEEHHRAARRQPDPFFGGAR